MDGKDKHFMHPILSYHQCHLCNYNMQISIYNGGVFSYMCDHHYRSIDINANIVVVGYQSSRHFFCFHCLIIETKSKF